MCFVCFNKFVRNFFAPLSVQPVTVQTALRRAFRTMSAQRLAVRTSQKPWANSVANRLSEAVANFRLLAGHGCLAKNSCHAALFPHSDYTLCDGQDEMHCFSFGIWKLKIREGMSWMGEWRCQHKCHWNEWMIEWICINTQNTYKYVSEWVH